MNFKTIIGLLLVILSVAAMYFWETEGRDSLVLTRTIVSAGPLEEGHIMKAEDFTTVKITHDAVADSCLKTDDLSDVIGLSAVRDIPANHQLTSADFVDPSLRPEPGQSLFVLPSSWIYSRSGAMAYGDRVSVYLLPEKTFIGNYLASYVGEDRVEIYCELNEYYGIYDMVSLCGPESLLLVMEEVSNG